MALWRWFGIGARERVVYNTLFWQEQVGMQRGVFRTLKAGAVALVAR